jgi:putative chitinase
MKMTVTQLNRVCGHTRYANRKRALATFLADKNFEPHELAQFLAQVLHESGRLQHVKEVWGPTAAQRRYEGRADLGNTQPGDGKRFMGRDIIQCTGRSNYRALTKWAQETHGVQVDFEQHPEKLEDPKFLGLGALWYWVNRVPQRFVDAGNIEMVTRRINGGLNGYSDRLKLFDRSALVLLGFEVDQIREFQEFADIAVDGVSGPQTRHAMHKALLAKQPPVDYVKPKPAERVVHPNRDGILATILEVLAKLLRGWK